MSEIFFLTLQQLPLEVINNLILSLELIVLLINNALKSVNRLLGSLCELNRFFLVVIFLIFLVVDEPSRVVSKLTGGEFCLHDKVGGGSAHLTCEIGELSLWHDFFEGSLELVYFFLFRC